MILILILHLTAFGTEGHVRGLLIQILIEVVVAQQRLRLLDHHVGTGKALVQDILVVKHVAEFDVGRGRRSLGRHMAWILHVDRRLALNWSRRAQLHLALPAGGVVYRRSDRVRDTVPILLLLLVVVHLDLLVVELDLLFLLLRAIVVEVHACVRRLH